MVIRNGGTVVHPGVGMTPAPVVQRDHEQIPAGVMIAPGSVGTMTNARNLIALLMATGPGLTGTTGAVDHVILIPAIPDHPADLFGPPDHGIITVATDRVTTDRALIVV